MDTYGVFVTVYNSNKLWGCIGNFYKENVNTINSIIKNTINAIFYDDRSTINEKTNESNLSFEITLLSPNSNIIWYDEFWKKYEPCKHGIILNGWTYLPEVMKTLLNDDGICNMKKFDNEFKKKFDEYVFKWLLKKGHGDINLPKNKWEIQ